MMKTNEQRFFFKLATILGVSVNNMKAAVEATEKEIAAEDEVRSDAPIEEGQTTDDKFDEGLTDLDTKADQEFNDAFSKADGHDEETEVSTELEVDQPQI